MTTIKKLAAIAAVATLALAAADLSASAQSSLTNGPNGAQPNTLGSDDMTGIDGHEPSRRVYRQRPVRTVRSAEASHRPLTVRRTVAATEARVGVAPVVVENDGLGRVVTGPLGLASTIVSLPFRALNGIFPATGDLGSNPLFLIGGPIHAIGDIAQVPFRVIGAPFGGTTIATY